MQSKSVMLMMLVMLSTFACGAPAIPTPTALPTTAISSENTVRVAYDNVSFVTPPFLTNKVTAEYLALREQRDPADDVPSYIQINIREPWDFTSPEGLYSQVLVYPLADLVQTYPQASDAAASLLGISGQGTEPLPESLPFWPLEYYSGVIGAPLESYGQPMLFAHPQRLDFASGRGVRYLTFLEQQPVRQYPLEGLIYTYQGLTDDGLYYVSVILPILIRSEETFATLEGMARQSPPEYGSMAELLNEMADDQFQSTLGEFDGMIESLVVY